MNLRSLTVFALSLTVFSQSAFAGSVFFTDELKQREAGASYVFIRHVVIKDAKTPTNPVIKFQECLAHKTAAKDQITQCRAIGDSAGYRLSDLEARDKNLKTKAVLEKSGTTVALVLVGGAAIVYGGVSAIAACALGCTALATGSAAWIAANGGVALAAGGGAAALAAIPNVVVDWTASGVLVASKTIDGDLDFYENNIVAKGSLKQWSAYKKALKQSLLRTPPAAQWTAQ